MKAPILSLLLLTGMISSPAVGKDEIDLKKAAYSVDTHVAKIFKSKSLKVPKVVDDGIFLRRTFLVGAGRIPTLKEAQSFLEIEDANKREVLVEYLLGTDGYRSHMQNYVYDMLRIREDRNGQGDPDSYPYTRFVYNAVRENMPWDQFARKLVGSHGSAWEPGNGAVGFYIRDKGMPLDNLSITMQIFAGERFEGALQRDNSYIGSEIPFIITPLKERVREPSGCRKKVTSGKRDAGKSRIKFAEWLTRENDNFDYITVNRMWERIMGSPITAPVDEYVEEKDTLSPELTRYLKGLLRDLNYDLKAFQKVLLLTKTFQFAANSKAFEAGVPQAFNGRQLQRMNAEQVWDSLVTLVTGTPDKLAQRTFSDTIFYKGKPRMVGEKTMTQLAREVLKIDSTREYRKFVDVLLTEFEKSTESYQGDGTEMGMSMMGRLKRPGPARGIARASELAAPAPRGHLLREFGQSNRELINSSSREANLAQVLQIMNGHVEKMVVSNSGHSP